MIVGIGMDLLDLDHMKQTLERKPKLVNRILTPAEQEIYHLKSSKRQLEYVAGRFAAKEAFSKAMGTGIGETVHFQNVTILNDEKGCPYVAESPFLGKAFVSISHSKTMVVAQVLLEH